MITPSKIFEVYKTHKGRSLYTKNLVPHTKVYDEKIIMENDIEYREWDPFTSKLCAAILKGCLDIKMRKIDVVLYLGSSYGKIFVLIKDILRNFFHSIFYIPVKIAQLSNYDFCFTQNHLHSFTEIKVGDAK